MLMNTDQLTIDIYSELTKQSTILEALQNAAPHWSSYLPSLVGLASIFVALILGMKSMSVSKRQLDLADDQIQASNKLLEKELKTTVIATGRREWIENLRTQSSEYLALCEELKQLYITRKIKDTDRSAVISNITKAQTYIQLMLNPNEDAVKVVVKHMKNIVKIIRGIHKNDEELNEATGGILLSQQMIRDNISRNYS